MDLRSGEGRCFLDAGLGQRLAVAVEGIGWLVRYLPRSWRCRYRYLLLVGVLLVDGLVAVAGVELARNHVRPGT